MPPAPTPYYGPGKSVAVIGASRGIGAELVRQLLARGCDRVYATERVVGKSKELSSMLSSGDGQKRLSVSSCDVSDPGSISSWTEGLANERSKGKRKQLDLVIHNAGIAEWSSLSSVTSETMQLLYKTNTIGPLLVAQQLDKQGLLGKGTTLANMTSKMGSMSDNGSGGTYAYRASKAALNAVTVSLARDLSSKGVCATVLHPGYVRTDMTNKNGLISAEESAKGLLEVLDLGASGELELSGRWYDFKREEIPW